MVLPGRNESLARSKQFMTDQPVQPVFFPLLFNFTRSRARWAIWFYTIIELCCFISISLRVTSVAFAVWGFCGVGFWLRWHLRLVACVTLGWFGFDGLDFLWFW